MSKLNLYAKFNIKINLKFDKNLNLKFRNIAIVWHNWVGACFQTSISEQTRRKQECLI